MRPFYKENILALQNGLVESINRQVKKQESVIKAKVGKLVRAEMKASKTYDWLTNGKGRLEMGLDHADSRLDRIISVLSEVKLSVSKARIRGGRLVGGIRLFTGDTTDFASTLALPASTVHSKKTGRPFPWWHWLVIAGDTTIVDYSYVETMSGHFRRNYSRSKQAGMRKEGGATYRVNPLYSGTKDDNWVSRTLNSEDFIEKLQNEIEKIL